MAKLQITLTKSLIGRNEKQRRTVKALGLTKMHSTVIKEDTPEIRGMIAAIDFMLTVNEVE